MIQRPLKTPLELVQEGYQAEGALVFLGNFFEEEKRKQLDKILDCKPEELSERREVYRYVCSLEKLLKSKVEIGIERATEQFADSEIQKEDI